MIVSGYGVADTVGTMAYGPESTSPAWETEPQEKGAERADQVYKEQLRTAQTLGEFRAKISTELKAVVEGDAEATQRARELQTAVNEVTQGHGHMQIDQSMAGTPIQGLNKGFSNDTSLSPDVLDADEIVGNMEAALIVTDHEDDKDLGHAGQISNVHTFIDAAGEPRDPILMIEGNVEENTENAHGVREGQPDKVYGEGQAWVRQIGNDRVQRYIRKTGDKSGDHVWMQVQILRDSKLPMINIMEKLQEAGFNEDETGQILEQVGKMRG